MSQDQIDYKAVRQRVEQGVQHQKRNTRAIFFSISLVFAVMFTIIGFGILSEGNLLGSEDAVAAVVVTSMASFMGALFQFISIFLDTKSGEASMREKLIARELGEEMLRMGEAEDVQQKEKRAMRLAADGELEEIVDEHGVSDELLDEERPRRRSSTE